MKDALGRYNQYWREFSSERPLEAFLVSCVAAYAVGRVLRSVLER